MPRILLVLTSALCCLFSSLAVPSATAALIVYEGFDTEAAAGPLAGMAGATSVGFDTAGWGDFSAPGGGSALYETAGLTFGSGATTLQSIAGNARMKSVDTYIARISRGLNVAVTGTVWGSFLTNRVVNSFSERDFIELLVNQSSEGHDNNAEFVVAAEEYESSNGGVRGRNNPIWPSYNTGVGISSDVTYLVLFKATNLGGSTGTAGLKNWILTSDQFDNFKLSGLTETELDTAATGVAFNNVRQRGALSYTPAAAYPRLTAADVLMMQIMWGIEAKYDELRLSNALDGSVGGGLDEVTPVPEPASMVMLGTALLGLLAYAWRKRKWAIPGIQYSFG